MVTDQQVRRLRMLVNGEESKEVSAAKAGMTAKTARKYLRSGKLPSEHERMRSWRTREYPFERDWDEVKGYLEVNPGLEAKTIFEELQRKYPGRYKDGQLRSLQRQIKTWRAIEGPAKEVFFAQVHKPGELGAFDFTHMSEIGVTINKHSFDHLVGHFVLTYSNWEYGDVCYSESYESLSECLQRSLWELGGVPRMIRTDRLSAAVHKECNPEVFTARYGELLKHYGTCGDKIQPGRANENGDVEQRHHRLKRAVKQALMLRGSKDFEGIDAYRLFLKKLFIQLNSGRKDRLREELGALKALPLSKMDACCRMDMRVGPGSTIKVKKNVYSVDSRLKGEAVNVRVYATHIEVWYAQRKADSFPRIRGEGKHKVNYRHIIEWLVRKPGAFENYRYREDLYPSSNFRMVYDQLRRYMPRTANKEYLKILYLAFKETEIKVDAAIQTLLGNGKAITARSVEMAIGSMDDAIRVPEVGVEAVDLKEYDVLLRDCAEVVVSNA